MSNDYIVKRRRRRIKSVAMIGFLMFLDAIILHFTIQALIQEQPQSAMYVFTLPALVILTVAWVLLLKRFIKIETREMTPAEERNRTSANKATALVFGLTFIVAYVGAIAAALELLYSWPFVSALLLVYGFLFVAIAQVAATGRKFRFEEGSPHADT